ncbi:MAG: hypothetical protein L3J28_01005 [Candidatus Polarisedimenticolaceae bacterium]|nr:hypothetical protein [Candidatus Polarisedimenticolaceae bacterium]
MSFDQYDIFFSGQLIEGSDETAARKKLAVLFKLPLERVEPLFSGKPVAVKRGVDMDTAVKYRTAFRDAGALIEIKPAASAGTTEAAPIPEAAPTTEQKPPEPSSGLSLNPANTGTLEDCAPHITPAVIPDISQISMAEVGATIDKSEPVPRLDIDTSALSIASDEER